MVTPLTDSPLRAAVRSVLEDPFDRSWVMQEVGLLSLWLDEDRELRLHVWDPASCTGEPPIHDHPFDFTSTVLAGEMVNTRFDESPTGVLYQRDRYLMSDEQDRLTDNVRLSSSSTRYVPGQSYSQVARDLHSSDQIPGTVTVLRRTMRPVEILTVCRVPRSPWVSGKSRPAEAGEVRRLTSAALELLA